MWTPDVYEGSPSPVTALFAIAPKVAAMALMMRLTYGAFGAIEVEWSQVLVALSIASMVVGALGAIMQRDIKRMMAYSSIAHMGYALAGLAAGSHQGALGVMIYMTGYIFMGAGSFAIILLMRRDGQSATRIADLQGLSRTHPMLALGLMIMMFSMAGIPPLAGFFGKWYVFLAVSDFAPGDPPKPIEAVFGDCIPPPILPLEVPISGLAVQEVPSYASQSALGPKAKLAVCGPVAVAVDLPVFKAPPVDQLVPSYSST